MSRAGRMTDASATTEEGEGGAAERTDTLQWGMDPVFFAPVRLLATHLALLTPVPDLPGCFTLNSHPVRRVEVMGICVERAPSRSSGRMDFAVDDGTAVARCVLWTPSAVQENSIQLGRMFRVQGRPSVYHGALQITTNTIQLEQDPDGETLHWLDAMHLAHAVYGLQPDVRPPHEHPP